MEHIAREINIKILKLYLNKFKPYLPPPLPGSIRGSVQLISLMDMVSPCNIFACPHKAIQFDIFNPSTTKTKLNGKATTGGWLPPEMTAKKYTCLQKNYYYIKNTGHCGVITFNQI